MLAIAEPSMTAPVLAHPQRGPQRHSLLSFRSLTPGGVSSRFKTQWRGLVVSALLGTVAAAQAAAPMAKTNPPGFYRIMLGDFEVTALSDGTMPGFNLQQLLTNVSAGVISTALDREFLRDPIEGSVNAYLINTGPKLVLVDVGAGKLFGPTLGRLIDNLRASGYRPEQVDEVVITHMHPDHVGGLVADGQMTFPNAVVRADRREAAFWLSPIHLDAAPAAQKDFFRGAMASVQPYAQAGKLKLFDDGAEITPGISVRGLPGHTEGHTSVVIESEGRKLVLWGDLIHAAPVQFPHPEVTIAFDSDATAAAAQRGKAFAEAAREAYLVGAAHISFPGLGRVRLEGQAYRWVPLPYGVLR
jgi:glyoxylase-like metal-dependent hydrolase (beta-lactamase superfamily II)